MNRFFFFAFLFFFVLSAYFLDETITPNPASRFIPVVTTVVDHSWKIDRYAMIASDRAQIDDHYYTDKAPFSSLFVIPFFYLYTLAFGVPPANAPLFTALTMGDILCGTLPFLLLMAALFYELGIKRRAKDAVFLSVLPVFSTFLWVYAGTYFGHLLAGALLLVAWMLLRRGDLRTSRLVLAGALCACAFLTEYPTAVVAAAFAAYVGLETRSVKSFMIFSLVFALLAALIFLYNYMLSGQPFTMVYHFVDNPQFQHIKAAYGFRWPPVSALFGLLFGLSRGLFVYAPLSIYIAYLALRQKDQNFKSSWIALLLGVFFYYLLIASYAMWWGGWAYGPRHLIPLFYVVLYEGVLFLQTRPYSKTLVAGLSALGVAGAWAANATTTYLLPDNFRFPITTQILPRLERHAFNPHSLPTLLFGMDAGHSACLWPILFVIAVGLFHFWYSRIQKAQASVT